TPCGASCMPWRRRHEGACCQVVCTGAETRLETRPDTRTTCGAAAVAVALAVADRAAVDRARFQPGRPASPAACHAGRAWPFHPAKIPALAAAAPDQPWRLHAGSR